MTPERWRRITEVFHLARARDVTQRAALLDDACAGDLALRAEVDAMLAGDGEAQLFGETPVFGVAREPPRFEPGAQFGAYRIDTLIGTGGMGEVYRAYDARLDRDIAIKVLSSDTFRDPGARQRLLREARSAAALNHPHVCTIFEVGDTGGNAYIAMELLEGKPLDELIPAAGFPLENILRYGVQIADAIAHAHERGIVHRDLKPANVMISDLGIAKVLDFGLAKVLALAEQPRIELTAGGTATGLVVGTASYMSPEQVLGHAIDERSDMFSFGALLYEMATGKRAFTGSTRMQVLDAVLHATPEAGSAVRRKVPAEILRLIDKALVKDSSRRYQRMSELSDDLRRLQTSGGAAVVHSRRRPVLRGSLRMTAIAGAVAVLIAIVWSNVPALREASVTNPMNALTGTSASSPFAGLRRPSGLLQRNSLSAYRAVTEARGLYGASRWEAALEASRRAADLDPEYAEAWAMLGKVYARLASPPGFLGGSIEDYRANALTAAKRAVELDSSSYEGQVALALAHRDLTHIDLSRAAARKAIALGPQLAEAYDVLGETYSETTAWGCGHDRDNAAAIALHRRAHSIEPNYGSLINVLKYDQRFEEALRVADEGLRLDPTSRRIRRSRAWILLEVGRLDEAERMLQEAASDGGIRGNDRLYLAGIDLKRGRLEAAAEGFRAGGYRGRGLIEVARQYVEAKLPQPALVHLEHGIQAEPVCAQFLLRTNAPYWSVIRSVPAARELLEKYSTQ